MAKGYPDYYRGSLLFGLRNDIPTGINMDDSGNLVALLKAMYGANPITLACDADGNLKVSVAVNTAIGAVEPKDASTIFKVDINAQTLANVLVKNYLGTIVEISASGSVANSAGATITLLTGSYLLNAFSFNFYGCTDALNMRFYFKIDDSAGQQIYPGLTWSMRTLSGIGNLLKCTEYDNTSTSYTFVIVKPIRILSSLKITFDNTSGQEINYIINGRANIL